MTFRLHRGDALEFLKTLPGGSVDAVITDPPYSSGTRREASKGLRKSMNRTTDDDEWFESDSLTTAGFTWLLRSCALEWKRVLRRGGHALVFIDWRMLPHLAAAIESADLRHVGVLVWNKTYFGMGAYFRNQHEMILHFTNGKSRPAQRADIGNVLSYPPVRGGDHPTEKPVPLLRDLVTVITAPGDTVLDPFAGSGSTGVAALMEGRHFIGCELDPNYHAIATKRLEAAAAQPRLLEAVGTTRTP